MRLWSASQLEVRPILVLLSSSALRGMNCSSSMVFRIDYDSWFDNHQFSMPQTRRQALHPEESPAKAPPKTPKRKAIAKVPLTQSQLRTLLQTRRFPVLSPQASPKGRRGLKQLQEDTFQILVPMEKLNCPICLQTFINPTVTECGHIFCLSCAEESLKHKSTCALCRNQLSYEEFRPCACLQRMVSSKVQNANNEEALNSYRQRFALFEEQEIKRRVSPDLKEGDLVDYWSSRKWRQGKIAAINPTSQGNIFNVQPLRDIIFEENRGVLLRGDSRLLAKHRTFTQQERPSSNRTQFRIEIFDFRDNAEQSLFLSMMEGGRRMEVSVREEEGDDSFIRFALSFERREA